MVETAALLVDYVLPHRPVRQWVLSFPYSLRFLLASQPQAMGKVLAIVNRAISTYLINKAGLKVTEAHPGAVTLIQRFGSALNLNLHFHALFIDGVFSPGAVRGTIGADRPGYGQLCLENSLSGWDYLAAIRHVLFERGGLAPLDRDAQSSWPKRLKRVFNGAAFMPSGAGIDVSVYSACGAAMKIIVGMPNHSIEDPRVIGKLLSHLETTSCPPPAGLAWCAVGARAPPPGSC